MSHTTHKKQSVLRFRLRSVDFMEVFERFNPNGYYVLNRVEWRGKEPRSCAVTNISSSSIEADESGNRFVEIEVTYRPKGVITYVGNTPYDGWTAMMLDRTNDGVLLDGKGQPLPDGAAPVYLPVEVYKDIDFNELDFGEFIEETAVETVKHVSYEAIMGEMREKGGSFGSLAGRFTVPRRSRPMVKLVLVEGDMVQATNNSMSALIFVNRFAPHLEKQIEERAYEAVAGFLEGRYSLRTFGRDDYVVADLSDLLLLPRKNEKGEDETQFGALFRFIKPSYLDDLAARLMSVYEVEVAVVEGEHAGLMFRQPAKKSTFFGE